MKWLSTILYWLQWYYWGSHFSNACTAASDVILPVKIGCCLTILVVIFLPTVGFIWYIIREGEKKYAIYTQSKIYLDITGGGGCIIQIYLNTLQWLMVINRGKMILDEVLPCNILMGVHARSLYSYADGFYLFRVWLFLSCHLMI